jgi:hypothetical protein
MHPSGCIPSAMTEAVCNAGVVQACDGSRDYADRDCVRDSACLRRRAVRTEGPRFAWALALFRQTGPMRTSSSVTSFRERA